jgi:hypothetical protein
MPGIGIGIGIGINRVPHLPPEVKFDLLENGLDFINEAVEIIKADKDHRRLKYSVIHLCSGVELVLKEVVRNKDWRLLFQELSEATIPRLKTGDFDSVRYKRLIVRLEIECKIKFSEEEKKNLDELRIKRNKIEHFKVSERVSDIKKMSSKVLKIIIKFIDENIDIEKVSPLSKKYIHSLPRELVSL